MQWLSVLEWLHLQHSVLCNLSVILAVFHDTIKYLLVEENSIAETDSTFGARVMRHCDRLGNALKHNYSTAVLPGSGQSTPKLPNQSFHR